MSDQNLALAFALDGVAAPASVEVERLVGVVGMLKDLPDPVIDPRFAAMLEARLMAEPIEAPAPALRLVSDLHKPGTKPVVAPAREPLPVNVITLPRRRFVVRKALVAAIAAAMLVALPIIASAQSLPGDPLFKIERFRQNSAISGAHGSHKVFVTENIARKWFGYGIQMSALAYPTDRVRAVFAQAGRFQSRAANLVLSVGTPSQIAELRRMIQADVTWLTESATTLGAGPSSPTLMAAINAANGHANLLSKALGLPMTGSLPVLAQSSGQASSTSSGSSQQSSGGSSSSSSGKSSGTTNPGTSAGPAPDAANPAPAVCHIIGEQQLGDALAGESKAFCAAQRATDAR